jgi:hypothetical protein
MDLQEAFYILGIITMSLMLIVLIAVASAVFVIKSKIDQVHRMIDTAFGTAGTIKDTVKTVIRKKR